jgi:hypothetical protein
MSMIGCWRSRLCRRLHDAARSPARAGVWAVAAPLPSRARSRPSSSAASRPIRSALGVAAGRGGRAGRLSAPSYPRVESVGLELRSGHRSADPYDLGMRRAVTAGRRVRTFVGVSLALWALYAVVWIVLLVSEHSSPCPTFDVSSGDEATRAEWQWVPPGKGCVYQMGRQTHVDAPPDARIVELLVLLAWPVITIAIGRWAALDSDDARRSELAVGSGPHS